MIQASQEPGVVAELVLLLVKLILTLMMEDKGGLLVLVLKNHQPGTYQSYILQLILLMIMYTINITGVEAEDLGYPPCSLATSIKCHMGG